MATHPLTTLPTLDPSGRLHRLFVGPGVRILLPVSGECYRLAIEHSDWLLFDYERKVLAVPNKQEPYTWLSTTKAKSAARKAGLLAKDSSLHPVEQLMLLILPRPNSIFRIWSSSIVRVIGVHESPSLLEHVYNKLVNYVSDIRSCAQVFMEGTRVFSSRSFGGYGTYHLYSHYADGGRPVYVLSQPFDPTTGDWPELLADLRIGSPLTP